MTDTNENNIAERERSGRYVHNAGFIAYFCIILALVLLRLLIYGLMSWGALDWAGDNGIDLIFTFVSQILILGLAPVLLIGRRFKKGVKGTVEFLQFKKPKPYIFIAFLIGAAGFVVYNIFLNSILSNVYSAMGWHDYRGGGATEPQPVWLFLLNILFIAVFPAICEEITHRGLLVKAMREGGASDVKIIFVTGLLFGLFHMSMGQFVFAMAMGWVAALLVVKSKSIWPAVIVHFVNNFIVTVISFAVSRMPETEAVAQTAEEAALAAAVFNVILWIFCIIATAVFVLLILWFINRARKAGDCPPKKKFAPAQMQFGAGNPFAQTQGIQLSSQPRHFSAAIQPRNQNNSPFAPPSANPFAPPQFYNSYAFAPVQYLPAQQPFGWQTQPPIVPDKPKLSAKDKIFYYAAVMLAGAITLISFIQGL